MAIIKCKPTTNGRCNMASSDFTETTRKKPEETLLESQSRTAGHNSHGHVIVRHHDGGHRQKYHITDFKRNKNDVRAAVKTIEYDPNRTVNIAPLHHTDDIKAYTLAPKGLKASTVVESGLNTDIKPSNTLPLPAIPTDIEIYNIELKPGKDGQLVRSADTVAQIPGNDSKYTLAKLQSGEVREILSIYRITIGSVGNEQHSLIQLDKTGRKRWLDKRPQSCGSVTNPNDHPHGGDEGKVPAGCPQPITPWGKESRGIKTRNSKARSKKLITRHHRGNK